MYRTTHRQRRGIRNGKLIQLWYLTLGTVVRIDLCNGSCGKKGDPIYNEDKQNTEISSTQQSALT